jgi:hypothetical protein
MLYVVCFVCGFSLAVIISMFTKKTKVYTVKDTTHLKDIGNDKIIINTNDDRNIFD